MSEVSLEAVSGKTSAEEPQMDCEENDRAEQSMSEENAARVDDSAEVRSSELYEVDIDSGEETEDRKKLENEREEERNQNESGELGAGSTDSVNKDGRETQGSPEEGGDSKEETKESTMAEEAHRSSAAEIPVTTNGELDQSPDQVFQRDSYAGSPGALNLSESNSFSSTAEGTVVKEGQMKGQPQSGALVLSDDLKNPALEKLELVRKWSINTYKCTRQILSEKLGKGSKTVDLELEAQIEVLRDNKRKYQQVIRLAQTLAAQLTQIMQTQKQLGDAFADLSLKSPELHEEFGYNAETQKLLSKNGETLLAAINFFISSVNTLVDKTIEDTMINIKQYEIARVEYDAYRTDLEELNLGPRDATTMPKIEMSQQQFQIHREKYEKMRNDVSIKLRFLEENKVKVLHNQLILFHNAIAAYYAGNQQQLEQTLKQFHIKLKMPGGDSPSWLEESH
ncbi:arfaptin-1 isoform X2 [Boleophthalmus pectinirostris]|uniref:arfaptin-1 isoform X2 n=1 Tax=Boleophthalmus pectinirostris TaxID=150288 RepID=UPI00242F42CF|nr:arfaptin-1 isoform X2 [Boleophthalmus pectinirostris]